MSTASEMVLPTTLPYGQAKMLAGSRNVVAAWLALIGLIVPPAEVTFNLGAAKFTVGRLAILLLLLPAAAMLLQKPRKLVISDFVVLVTAGWMVAAGAMAPGSISVSSSVAETIELAGGYFAARAFFFGPLALKSFIKVLTILAFAAIILAIADSASGRLIVHDTVAGFLGVGGIGYQYRNGMVRAASTFDHAILFGAFCCFVGTILLHTESNVGKRIAYVSICVLGCVLSWTSSALMGFAIVFVAFAYDRAMRDQENRWTIFLAVMLLMLLGFFLASNNPMGWIISHLTLDPESGYYRLMIWDAVFGKLSESWYFGFGFNEFGSWILDATVDSIWLVLSLRFGVPAALLLCLMNVAAFLPPSPSHSKRNGAMPAAEAYMARAALAFTTVLCMFMFIGLTVHFWNYMWIFWGICIGIRASIREWCLVERSFARAAETRWRHMGVDAVRESNAMIEES